MAAGSLKLLDIGDIIKFGEEFFKDSSYTGDYIPSAVREFLLAAFQDNDVGAFVSKKDGEICGVLIGTVTQSFANFNKIAYDIVFIAKGGCGKELIDAYEKWAKKKGATKIILSSSAGRDLKSIERLYSMQGYKPIGIVAEKEV